MSIIQIRYEKSLWMLNKQALVVRARFPSNRASRQNGDVEGGNWQTRSANVVYLRPEKETQQAALCNDRIDTQFLPLLLGGHNPLFKWLSKIVR